MREKLTSNFSLGSDPELVGMSGRTGKPKSLVGLIGTKDNPTVLPEGCLAFSDNVMCEITVPPAETFNELFAEINTAAAQLRKILSSMNIGITFVSSANYSDEELQDDLSQTFGCDPSFCVYTSSVTKVPDPSEVGNLRTAGFHIHFGWSKKYDVIEYINFIKLCDLCLGIPSMQVMSQACVERMKIYGCLGDYRLQPWGVEYRTLGSGVISNYSNVVREGIDNIKKIINSQIVDEVLFKFEDKLYDVFSKKLNSKHIPFLCQSITSLCTEL